MTKKTDDQRRTGTQSVPVGLEQVLFTAAMEPAFKAELIADREAAVERRSFVLTDSQRAMLRVAPKEQLGQMIDSIDTSSASLERRDFLRAVAATMVTIAAGSELAGCGSKDGSGKGPDTSSPSDGQQQQQLNIEQTEPMPTTGIRPDPPEPLRDAGPAKPPTTSIDPERRPTRGSRPDPPPMISPPVEQKE